MSAATMSEVLFVSKPVAPPWNDSNKNLVRDIARNLVGYRARVLVPRGAPLEGVASDPLYEGGGSYAPSRAANARVLARLLLGSRADVWHFFFAPNPLTLRAGRAAAALRRTPTVHTVASAPDSLERVARELFADRVIVLSEHTRARLARVGVDSAVIPAAVHVEPVELERVQRIRTRFQIEGPYVLYPGDLEFGDGARTFVRAAAAAKGDGLRYVVASRPKTAAAAAARRALEREARDLDADVLWLGEVDDIHALVAGASVVSLVTDTLHAKMDWPLVVLEALRLGVPCVVGADIPASELRPCGACEPIRSGDERALRFALRAWSARDDALRARLELAGAWVRDRCAPPVVARAYERVYDDVLSRRPTVSRLIRR